MPVEISTTQTSKQALEAALSDRASLEMLLGAPSTQATTAITTMASVARRSRPRTRQSTQSTALESVRGRDRLQSRLQTKATLTLRTDLLGDRTTPKVTRHISVAFLLQDTITTLEAWATRLARRSRITKEAISRDKTGRARM